MDRDIFGYVFGLLSVLLIIGGLLFLLIGAEKRFNSTNHSDDVKVTEWVSPDGVHYWYQQAGYHAMLAPRYDSDGNLVID